MTDASHAASSSIGRRRVAGERETPAVARPGDGAGGLVLCGDRERGGDLRRAGAPDCRGGRDHAMGYGNTGT